MALLSTWPKGWLRFAMALEAAGVDAYGDSKERAARWHISLVSLPCFPNGTTTPLAGKSEAHNAYAKATWLAETYASDDIQARAAVCIALVSPLATLRVLQPEAKLLLPWGLQMYKDQQAQYDSRRTRYNKSYDS